MTTRHSPAEVAEVAGLRAAGLTHEAIAERTGIPRRTVSAILKRQPVADVVTAEVQADMLTRMKEAHERALTAVHAGLDDPKARLADKAAALRILGEQINLTEGRSTSNLAVAVRGEGDYPLTDGLSDAERAALRAVIDRGMDEEMYGPVWVIVDLVKRLTPAQEASLAAHLDDPSLPFPRLRERPLQIEAGNEWD